MAGSGTEFNLIFEFGIDILVFGSGLSLFEGVGPVKASLAFGFALITDKNARVRTRTRFDTAFVTFCPKTGVYQHKINLAEQICGRLFLKEEGNEALTPIAFYGRLL